MQTSSSDLSRVLALDIGGSSVKYAWVSVDCRTLTAHADSVGATPVAGRAFNDLLASVRGIVGREGAGASSVPIAISTTGAVTSDGLVMNSGSFDGYRRVQWQAELKADVFVVNDGHASAFAEYSGWQSETDSLVHFVVGTGIGGGLIDSGKLVLGAESLAGSLGHIKIDRAAREPCSCRNHGCVESLAAVPAVLRYWHKLSNDGNRSFQAFRDALMRGDEHAVDALNMAGEALGWGIANVIATVNPHVITVGGGLAQVSAQAKETLGSDIYLEAAAEVARSLVFRRPRENTVIELGKFGNDAGLLGAALLRCAKGDS